MSVGKYSPTVMFSYKQDPDWFKKNGGGFGNGKYPQSDFDDDGFDSYGYDKNEVDRAGNTENSYQNEVDFETGEAYYYLFEKVQREWCVKTII